MNEQRREKQKGKKKYIEKKDTFLVMGKLGENIKSKGRKNMQK